MFMDNLWCLGWSFLRKSLFAGLCNVHVESVRSKTIKILGVAVLQSVNLLLFAALFTKYFCRLSKKSCGNKKVETTSHQRTRPWN